MWPTGLNHGNDYIQTNKHTGAKTYRHTNLKTQIYMQTIIQTHKWVQGTTTVFYVGHGVFESKS